MWAKTGLPCGPCAQGRGALSGGRIEPLEARPSTSGGRSRTSSGRALITVEMLAVITRRRAWMPSSKK